MQEEVESRSLTLAINTAKLTGRTLKNAIAKLLAYRKNKKAVKAYVHPQGKQSVKKLIGQNQGVSSIELADGSTIFLDEIGNLSYGLQAKLLTALQRRSIVRVGGSTQIPINVRLVCATNRNLQQMVNDGEFREDLLYRINTIHLELPALRQRKSDIVPLAEKFLRQYGDLYNKVNLRLSEEAEKKLTSLPWYGNIRELQHAIEKAVILSNGGMISAEDIDGGNQQRREKPLEEVQTLDEMESRMIEKTIRECEGNLSVVAARLGISRQTLYNKIKRYGL